MSSPVHTPASWPPAYPQPPAPQNRTGSTVLIVVLAVAAVLAVGSLAAALVLKQQKDATTPVGHSANAGQVGNAPAEEGAPKAAEPEPTEEKPPPAPAGSITDEGILLVPSEVKPGQYRATVPPSSFGCYWARLSNTSGESMDAIIANGLGDPGTKLTVTIKATDKAFETRSCGTWQKIK
jgi:hypothetical protein